mgnify:CR=1 FL=1
METNSRLLTGTAEPQSAPFRRDVRRGFVAMIPLWPGVCAFGMTYAILARSTGFSIVETQALTMLVFAGAAQLAVITLDDAGASAITIVVTVFILNLRHVLYGLSLNTILDSDERPSRPLLAFLLTDESYGVTIREHLAGRGGAAYLFGTGLSLYASFGLATLGGLLFGSFLPDPERSGLSFIFPLSFLALLLPLLRSHRAILIAAISAGTMLIASQFANSGVAFLIAAITAATIGAILDRDR